VTAFTLIEKQIGLGSTATSQSDTSAYHDPLLDTGISVSQVDTVSRSGGNWASAWLHWTYIEVERTLDLITELGISIPDRAPVRDYLITHEAVLNLLPQMCQDALAEVDEDTRLYLERYIDPEFDDTHLVLYLRQTNYSETILDIIDRIRARHRHLPILGYRWFHVTTDFMPPR
jgi:hypothetical protein